MRVEQRRVAVWWISRVALSLAALLALSSVLAHSRFDLESLRPFHDPGQRTFPFRYGWFFEDVLHDGGRDLVGVATAGLLLGAVLAWRRPRWREHARRAAFVAASVLLTVAIAGAWRDLVRPMRPWDTVPFGGAEPWSSVRGFLGPPGAHAASGFALVSLYFVGASMGTRHRGTWLAPGFLLGLLFSIGEHVRGARPPSCAVLSLAIAWASASALAFGFRKWGGLAWNEHDEERSSPLVPEEGAERAMPWLVGGVLALAGTAFFAVDQVMSLVEESNDELYEVFEVVELLVMAGGLGVGGWLLVDRIGSLRARSARRLQEEQERRLQILGKMAASVAHEVRNPLHSMRLIVDEQRIDIPALESHPLRDDFEGCFDRIDRAVDLVYRLARPESGETERADLAACTRESIAALERIAKKPLPFRWLESADAASVQVSRFDVRLVVDNLLRNAVEASPPDAAVTLALQREDGSWKLRVENAGRLEKRAQDAEARRGLGLGMAISRQIVESAHGSLEVTQVGDRVRALLSFPRASEERDEG